jgi:hypothetical protein
MIIYLSTSLHRAHLSAQLASWPIPSLHIYSTSSRLALPLHRDSKKQPTPRRATTHAPLASFPSLVFFGVIFRRFPCISISNLCVFCAPTPLIPTCSVPTPPFAFVSLYLSLLYVYISLSLTHTPDRFLPLVYFTILYCTYGLLVVLGFSLVPHPRPLSRLLLLPHILWIRVGVSNISIGYSLGRCQT